MKKNFDWISRFRKVVFIIITISVIPISFFNYSSDINSKTLVNISLSIFVSYIILILLTKIILYITKNENFIKSGFDKKRYIILATPIIIILLIALFLSVFVEPAKYRKKEAKKLQEYILAISEIDKLREQLVVCSKSVVEQKYKEEVRSCNLLKNKIHHDYNFCVSLTSINSPASCLYENDYESIDCSEKTLNQNAISKVAKKDLSIDCQRTLEDVENADSVIQAYNKK